MSEDRIGGGGTSPDRDPAPSRSVPRGPQFRVGPLMITIVGIAIGLWLAVSALKTGAPAPLFLSVPVVVASVRTGVAPVGREGQSPGDSDRLAVFVRTFSLTFCVMIASAAAFFVTCSTVVVISSPGGNLDTGFYAGTAAGVASLIGWPIVIAWIGRRSRRKRSGRGPE